MLIARALGPDDFGVFAVLGALANVVGAFADLGLTQAAVKRIASAWPTDRSMARERGRVFFWLRLVAAASIALALALLAIVVPESALGSSLPRGLLILAFLGVVATASSGAVGAQLQATKQFGRLALVGIANPALTAILASALALTGHLDLVSALVVLGIAPSLASFVIGSRFLPSDWHLRPPSRDTLHDEGTELIALGRWLWVAGTFAMIAGQLDVLLIDRWTGPATVGAYALALNLATKVDVVNSSLYTVLLPIVSSLDGPGARRRYVRQSLIRSTAIGLALVPLIFLVGPFITFFYGAGYVAATGIFQQMLGVVVFDAFATPLILLVYHFDRPRLQAGADALRAVTVAMAGVSLIPVFGPTGAVLARFASRAVGATVTLAALSSPTPPRRVGLG